MYFSNTIRRYNRRNSSFVSRIKENPNLKELSNGTTKQDAVLHKIRYPKVFKTPTMRVASFKSPGLRRVDKQYSPIPIIRTPLNRNTVPMTTISAEGFKMIPQQDVIMHKSLNNNAVSPNPALSFSSIVKPKNEIVSPHTREPPSLYKKTPRTEIVVLNDNVRKKLSYDNQTPIAPKINFSDRLTNDPDLMRLPLRNASSDISYDKERVFSLKENQVDNRSAPDFAGFVEQTGGVKTELNFLDPPCELRKPREIYNRTRPINEEAKDENAGIFEGKIIEKHPSRSDLTTMGISQNGLYTSTPMHPPEVQIKGRNRGFQVSNREIKQKAKTFYISKSLFSNKESLSSDFVQKETCDLEISERPNVGNRSIAYPTDVKIASQNEHYTFGATYKKDGESQGNYNKQNIPPQLKTSVKEERYFSRFLQTSLPNFKDIQHRYKDSMTINNYETEGPPFKGSADSPQSKGFEARVHQDQAPNSSCNVDEYSNPPLKDSSRFKLTISRDQLPRAFIAVATLGREKTLIPVYDEEDCKPANSHLLTSSSSLVESSRFEYFLNSKISKLTLKERSRAVRKGDCRTNVFCKKGSDLKTGRKLNHPANSRSKNSKIKSLPTVPSPITATHHVAQLPTPSPEKNDLHNDSVHSHLKTKYYYNPDWSSVMVTKIKRNSQAPDLIMNGTLKSNANLVENEILLEKEANSLQSGGPNVSQLKTRKQRTQKVKSEPKRAIPNKKRIASEVTSVKQSKKGSKAKKVQSDDDDFVVLS